MEVQTAFRVFQPSLALQSFVSSYTVAYNVSSETWVRRQPAYPQQYLIFYPLEPQLVSSDGSNFQRLSNELLIGPFTEAVYLFCSPFQPVVIVALLPGALHRLTRLPLHEILNQPLDGINGFGNEMRRVNEQLGEMKMPEQMIKIVETFLLKKVQNVKEPLPIDHTFNLLIASPNQYNIAQLANLACVSLRQFERQFLEHIGTNPTTFIRQVRFAKALRLKRNRPELKWTTIAYECGYFDQMHFIRDFKQFTSATPTSFTNFVAAPSVTKG